MIRWCKKAKEGSSGFAGALDGLPLLLLGFWKGVSPLYHKIAEDWIYYTKSVYGQEEIDAVVKCLKEDWLGNGKYTEEFEKRVAKIFGKKYGLFVNSGSSANLLALELMNFPKGSEVITPACTFGTTNHAFRRNSVQNRRRNRERGSNCAEIWWHQCGQC